MSGKERPILFSGPMVRALLDGRKTQTRRVVKPQPPDEAAMGAGVVMSGDAVSNGVWCWLDSADLMEAGVVGDNFRCPYGVPGDRLWVKETWRPRPSVLQWDLDVTYAADSEVRTIKDGEFGERDWTMPKAAARGNVSPLFMPRWASRLTLEITDVRVQRLQDISEADAIAEGATSRPNAYGFNSAHDGWSMDWSRVGTRGWDGQPRTEKGISLATPKSAFANFINELHGGPRWNFYYNGDSRYPQPLFDANPWVWVVTFEVTS